MFEAAKFHVGIKALVMNEKNEILLLKAGEEETKYTGTDFWDFPGGRMKTTDNIEDGLKRSSRR